MVGSGSGSIQPTLSGAQAEPWGGHLDAGPGSSDPGFYPLEGRLTIADPQIGRDRLEHPTLGRAWSGLESRRRSGKAVPAVGNWLFPCSSTVCNCHAESGLAASVWPEFGFVWRFCQRRRFLHFFRASCRIPRLHLHPSEAMRGRVAKESIRRERRGTQIGKNSGTSA